MKMNLRSMALVFAWICLIVTSTVWSMPKKKSPQFTDDEMQFLADAQRRNEEEAVRNACRQSILSTAYPLIDLVLPSGCGTSDPEEMRLRYQKALRTSCSALRSFKNLFCAFHDIIEHFERIKVQSLQFRLTARARKSEWISDNVEFLALHNRMSNFYLSYLKNFLLNNRWLDGIDTESYAPEVDRDFLEGIVNDGHYSQSAREFAAFLLSGVELYISRNEFSQKQKIFKEQLRPAFDQAATNYLGFLKKSGRACTASPLYDQMKKDYDQLVTTKKLPIDSIGEWIADMQKKYEDQLQRVEDGQVQFDGVNHEEVVLRVSRLLTEATTAQKASNQLAKKKKDVKSKRAVAESNSGASSLDSAGDLVEEETPFTIQNGRFGSDDPTQNIAFLCQRILAIGRRERTEQSGTSTTRRIDAVLHQLKRPSSIKRYVRSTVADWFGDLGRALEREVIMYPQSNQTEEQKKNNIVAHTFPLEIDGLLEQLAYKFDATDKPGEILYVVPGSMRMRGGSEIPGYYTLLVDIAHDENVCYHRSFTRREYSLGEEWSNGKLYTRPNKAYIRQSGDAREFLAKEAIQQLMVESNEAGIAQDTIALSNKIKMRVDALSISVEDRSGNVFRFMDTR